MPEPTPHIGMLRENPLHADLKEWYRRSGDSMELMVDGFVIDLVRDDLLIEVQTAGFASMKRKVMALLDLGHRLRIVHPIALDKWIVKLGDGGEVLSRRLSPRHGVAADLFSELVSFPALIDHPMMELEVVLTRQEELRTHSPGQAWRRKGWIIAERRLVEVVESQRLSSAADLLDLVPDGLADVFTTADLSDCIGRPRRLGQQAAYCLRQAGVIVAVGKTGNAIEYRMA